MKNTIIKIAMLSLYAAVACGAMAGCTPQTEVPTRKVKTSSELKVRNTAIDRSVLDHTDDNWTVVLGENQVVNSRNPFRGFSDTIMAENLLKKQAQEEQSAGMQLAEQLYPTRDYRIVGVITGTADPKVYVMDPSGNRFILRRGSLIGNNNGSISSIRRDGIEVYERVADKGQYIDLPLFEETNSDKKSSIQLSLQ